MALAEHFVADTFCSFLPRAEVDTRLSYSKSEREKCIFYLLPGTAVRVLKSSTYHHLSARNAVFAKIEYEETFLL